METLAYDNTKPWGDKLYEEEQTKVLQMSRAEWITYINAAFARLRGNGAALIQTLAWATQMGTPEPAPEMDEDTRNWRVWKDMVEEPSKYGSDIGEWLQLDEEVRRGPKRWRVDAYWNAKVREIQVREAEAATKIQALWRGIHPAVRRRTAVHLLPLPDARRLPDRGDGPHDVVLRRVHGRAVGRGPRRHRPDGGL
jgi:hypothetical protein